MKLGAYSIQGRDVDLHRTDGRMVATDEALLLFADATEAMGYVVA